MVKASNVILSIVALLSAVALICFGVVAVKAGIDGTSLGDAWNSIFAGVTKPETPVEPTPTITE